MNEFLHKDETEWPFSLYYKMPKMINVTDGHQQLWYILGHLIPFRLVLSILICKLSPVLS